MKNKILISFLAFVGLIVLLGGIGYTYASNWYDSAIFESNLPAGETFDVVVNEGETFQQVAERMEAEGQIKSAVAVRIYLRLENKNPNIKVGTYSIRSESTIPEIIQILELGQLKPGIRVTIKEGLRHEQTGEKIQEALGFDSKFNVAEFNQIIENPNNVEFSSEVTAFLQANKPEGKSLEGFLYPDTYEFDKDFTATMVIDKMILNFIIKVNENIDLDNLNLNQTNITNLYDALILASVIEREASLTDDRTQIASVFHNRLAQGIALQSDATVNYVTGKNDAGVSFEDTRIDSPYNTYKYPGLMPTPINSPRIESIKAALYPKETSFLYFLHDSSGKSYYNETFEAHQTDVCNILGC